MGFDPDAFLADGGTAVAEAPKSGFDPDAFLSESKPAFDPDAFLSEKPQLPDVGTGFQDVPLVPMPITRLPGTVVNTNPGTYEHPLTTVIDKVAKEMKPLDPTADALLRQKEQEMGIAPFSLGPEGVQEAIAKSQPGLPQNPLIELPKPDSAGVGSGIVRGLESTAEGLTTPENLSLVAGIAKAPKIIQQAASLGFSASMIKGAYDTLTEAPEGEAPGQKAERITQGLLTLAMGLAAGKHGVEARAPITAVEREASMENARAKVEAARPTDKVETGSTKAVEPLPESPLPSDGVSPSPSAESATAAPEVVKPAEPLAEPAVANRDPTAGEAPPGGPGAMGPVEAGEMAAANRVTGTKNEQMRLEREARGEEEIVREQPIANREAITKAREELAANPNRGEEIVERLKTSAQDVRTISYADEAVLMAHKVELMKQRAEQESIYADGNRSPEEHAVAAQKLTEIESRMNDVDQATYASGAEWGRLGQLRQRLLREDYSFEALERRARIAKGDALTPGESVKIKEQAAKIADLEKQLEGATKKRTEKDATDAAEAAVQDLKKKAKPGKAKDLEEEGTRLTDAIKERVKAGDTPADLRNFVQRLALNLVRRGVRAREALIDSVHAVLEPLVPGIDRSTTRDLISGYGKFDELSKEPAKVTLRGLKGEMQQISKIEDMQQRNQAPRKTGMERRAPTDEERRLIKEVNELKKKGGYVVTDPAKQLKTAMDAIKTRLRNDIRDLDNAMATQERIPGKKSSIEYDAEAKALKEQRDAKRAEYDKLFPKEPLTDEQLLTQAGKALDRSIADLESSLKEGRLYPDKTSRRLTSPEIEAKRARLNALREERQHLRDLDTATVEAKKEAQLQKAIDNAQKAIPEPKEGAPTVDTERVAQLKQTLKEARDARATSPEAMREKLEAATDAVRKSIAEYDRRLREGDTSRASSQDPLRSNELDALRSERDALERAYREMVNAEKPKKSRDEIALQAYKTRTANRIAELEEKIAKGDFATRPKRIVAKDAAADKLAFDLAQTKKAFQEGLLKYKLDQRMRAQRMTDAVKETFHTLRAIMTGGEFSGLLRQGKLAVLSRPVETFKGAVPAMFKAFKSAEGEHAMMRDIQIRPNADLYKKAGLEIHDPNNFTAAQLEGNYRSRWANKIPFIAGSGRAYTVFLNRLRADLFDTLELKLRGREGPVSLDQAKVIATYINEATGAGGLGVKGQKAAELLNYTFFSPKYVMSRFQMLSGHSMWKGDMATRRLIAEEYARILAGAVVMYSLYSLATDKKVETDPRSSDFGKIKIGDTTVDPLAGLSQATVFMSRMAKGQTKNSKGEIVQLRESDGKKVPFGKADIPDTITRFARSKLSPIPGAVYDRLANKDFQGKEVSTTGQLLGLAMPMTYKDIYEALKAQGMPEGMALSVLAFFGEGVNTYEHQKAPR